MNNIYSLCTKVICRNVRKAGLQVILAFFLISGAAAQNFTLTSNGDTHAVTPTSGAADAGGLITLRSALESATAIVGTHIITIPGTITSISLTLGQITVGVAGSNITVNGPGKAVLTIKQTTANRVFVTGTGAVSFILNDLTLSMTYAGATTYSGGGGAIQAGGNGAVTSLTNVAINNFRLQVGNGGALSSSQGTGTNTLSLTNCDFSNNLCGGGGGAVSFNGSTGTITNCTFTGNGTGVVGANTGGGGGALSTTGPGGGTNTCTVTGCTFTNNSTATGGGQGGTFYNTNGTLTISYCRITGSTAASAANGNVIAQPGGGGTMAVVANNDWWGVNDGPVAGDNVVLAAGGSITVTRWLQLKASASPASLCPGGTSTVTASFLSNNLGEAIAAANIGVLVGRTVSFTAITGTLSGAQSAIQSSGTATVTYTGGASAGSANAVVDNVPAGDLTARASISLTAGPSITTSPSASTACAQLPVSFTGATSGTVSSYSWQESADAAFTSPTTLTNTGVYSNTNTTTLNISDNSLLNGKYYRLVAVGTCTVRSTGALLTATAPTLAAASTIAHAVGTSNDIYYGGSCGIIAKAVPSGASPLTGSLTSQVWVEAAVPKVGTGAFVQRHYQLTPGTAPATATATVTLYFSQAEFNNFNADAGSILDLPTGAGDATGISHVRVAKYSGSSGNGSGLPGSYSGAVSIITPTTVTYNATFSRWEITFPVAGFSSFILQTSVTVLPVKLVSFTAQLNGTAVGISWETATAEEGNTYTLQHSTSGTGFTDINTRQADRTTTRFGYTDPLPAPGLNYYRLQVTDAYGKMTYSNILVIRVGSSLKEFSVYPNPLQQGTDVQLSLSNFTATSTQIVDVSGRILYNDNRKVTGSYTLTLPAAMKSGVYYIKVFSADKVFIRKLFVQ